MKLFLFVMVLYVGAEVMIVHSILCSLFLSLSSQICFESYNRLLTENVTSSYKKVKDNIALAINNEALRIATDLDIQDRVECMAEQQAFITQKDHKKISKTNHPAG